MNCVGGPAIYESLESQSQFAAWWWAWHDILCGWCAEGPPNGVVTFLFTDVEGSTRRWEAGADEMRAAC
jgi:class 3 adenylate cyclase